MNKIKLRKDQRALEIMLLIVVLGMTSLLHQMQEHKMVILNLFFLPVVLSGYFLGRSSAGTLAVFSAVAVSVVVALDATGFASYSAPVVIALAVTIWAGVLGLTALLIGTLCDERAAKVDELHAAYVGVVEVLAKYLQSANPRIKARSIRCAELSESVAQKMRLSQKDVDDVRVGALLFDIGNVEITTSLISKAVGTIEEQSREGNRHTFQGMEFVHSLEPVLSGAIPLLLNQDDAVHDCLADDERVGVTEIPLGAKIIRTVRAYVELTERKSAEWTQLKPADGIAAVRRDRSNMHDESILRALESVVLAESRSAREAEPVLA